MAANAEDQRPGPPRIALKIPSSTAAGRVRCTARLAPPQGETDRQLRDQKGRLNTTSIDLPADRSRTLA
jgi:hypothetical protein